MDRWVDGWTDMCWVSSQALDSSCSSKQLSPGQWAEPAARAMGQGAGSRPNKVDHDREGGGIQGQVGREERCQERSGKDGWSASGAGGRELRRGVPVRADGGKRGRQETDVPGLISDSAHHL